MRPRDHDRPGCGGRKFAGFLGSRRLHGRPSRKGHGRGYQGPGCGRSGVTERSRRGGNSGNRGGDQSQRLWDRGGDQSRRIGRSRRLPSSGGDRSREIGRNPRLLCSGSGISRGLGRSRLLGREPGEEGCMAALGHGDGGSGGAFLSRQRGDACLLLLEGPCCVLKARTGSGGVSMQSGELAGSGATSRSCSAVASSIAWRSEVVVASSWLDTRVRASTSSTSCREIFSSSARCAGSRLAQMNARCPRWGGGPSLMAREARGSGTVGHKPGVRPVLEPVVARRSVGAMRGGPRADRGPKGAVRPSWW